MADPTTRREHALAIWRAAVDAVLPEPLVRRALAPGDSVADAVRDAPRILVVGAGKAGPGMAAGLEAALTDRLDRVEGLVNVPEGMTASHRKLRLHPGRPQGVNEPTAEGLAGADEMLRLLASAGPDDVAVCLLSGGGSALLPAPAEGITLSAKQAVTKLLHRSGATINEMNCVRKHLSRVKGGRLAEAFRGKLLLSLIISDVVGDPLDVIASGPTAPDPTTFEEALGVLAVYDLREKVPPGVLRYLERGAAGEIPETPKQPDPRVVNRIVGSNRLALAAAELHATGLGYSVWNAGSAIEGETCDVAAAQAELAMKIRRTWTPVRPPACLLSGGESTVTLGDSPGKGGRNQEFVLAAMIHIGERNLDGVAVLSGGTDGEDGPTDAAGAVADAHIPKEAARLHLNPNDHLRRHDAYPFFEKTGGLIRTGLTGTNVMDVRVILVT
jgi:hydroxypyruvate reductase/glycerate 2-kinase